VHAVGMSRSVHAMGAVERRSEIWIVRALAIIRATQTVPYLFVALRTDRAAAYTSPALVLALYSCYVLWSIVLFRMSLRRGVVTKWLVIVDALVAVTCIASAGRLFRPSAATTWLNWTVGPWIATAIIAALYLPIRYAIGVGCLAALAYGSGLAQAISTTEGRDALVGNTVVGVFFTFAASLGAGLLRRLSRESDRTAAALLEARTKEAAWKEQARISSMIHNSALQTLVLLSREPGLSEDLRQRCITDAHSLRTGLVPFPDTSPVGLAAQLTKVVREQRARLRLEIAFNMDDLPDDLPPSIVEAMTSAVMEALNNVDKHSGTREATVIATGDGAGGIEVTVTDKGKGFNPDATPRGFGLAQSIIEAVRTLGGQATVTSFPGLGTSVELRWTR
jgi:signal transduction histidine kinase